MRSGKCNAVAEKLRFCKSGMLFLENLKAAAVRSGKAQRQDFQSTICGGPLSTKLGFLCDRGAKTKIQKITLAMVEGESPYVTGGTLLKIF